MRFNQPFGDTVDWDLIPNNAIDRLNIEGSNPVFGLNALGGSINVQMKNGFTWHGGELSLSGGSFGQRQGEFQWGYQSGSLSGYLAGTVLFLYLLNTPERRLPVRSIVNALAFYWILVVIGGWAGVLFPSAFAAQERMQVSVLGEGAVALTGSYFYDFVFDKNPRVKHRGKLVDAGDRFLSVCLGHQVLCGCLGLDLGFKDIVFQGTQSHVDLGDAEEQDRGNPGSRAADVFVEMFECEPKAPSYGADGHA